MLMGSWVPKMTLARTYNDRYWPGKCWQGFNNHCQLEEGSATNLGLVTSKRGVRKCPSKESNPRKTSLRRPGIEPRSTAGKAAMLATTPPTLPCDWIDKIAGTNFQR